MREDTFSQPHINTGVQSQASIGSPPKEMKGAVRESDGYEYLEYPSGSGAWYYRVRSTGEWAEWAQ